MRTKRRKQASKRDAVERPPPERVIEAVAAASSVPSWMLFSPRRSPNLAKPRAAALYLLRQEAGLRSGDVARLTGRKRETVHRVTQQVAFAVGHDEQLADLIRRAQRLLASPHLNGQAYDAPPWSRSAGLLLGLEAARIAAGLTKTELARRAGITAETLIRVERLQRATSASTLSKLATALEIPTPLLMHGKSDPLDMPRCALMSGTPATDPPGT
jgi:DNA-binding XRE family transcriptional regulator